MKPLYDGQEYYYKKMLDLQEQLRKSEEERIRLEERFNLLVRESRNRHQECINRLRMRYVEYLEDQRMRDERNNRLLGKLDKIDHSLTLMTAKTERLNNLRKQYEAYLLRSYGNHQRPSGSVTADSGLESQPEQDIPASPIFLPVKSTPQSPANHRATTDNDTMRVAQIPIAHYNYKLPSFSWLSAESSDDISKKPILSSYLDKFPSCDVNLEESGDCLLKDFTIKPNKTTTIITDPVSTAERNLEQYLNQIKQMHRDVDKSELEHSADEAEQNTSGDLLNVSLTEDHLESPSVEEETTREKMRLRFARQAFANPRAFSQKSQDATKTPPNSFDKTSESPPKPIEELTKYPESINSFRDRLRRSEFVNEPDEPKIIEESTKFSEKISPVRDKFASSEPKPIEEITNLPMVSETISSFKDRFKGSDFDNQAKPKENSPTFSESIGSLREKFNRTDFMNSRNKPIIPDSFEDAFAKLTRMKEPRRPTLQETLVPVIIEDLPTPPPEEQVEKESSSEQENDGIEDDYDDTVDIDSWMPDDVEPEPQEIQRKDDILDLPRRKLESIEEVEHAEDEEVEEEERQVEIPDVKDAVVIEEVVEDDDRESVELKNVEEIVEQPQQQDVKVEALSVGYEAQEQVAYPNAAYIDQQQYYEEDGSIKQQYQTGSEYYEQGDAQQYQYTDDPNQPYAYDPNAQYAEYEGQYAGYEQYQQYDPSQYDSSQYDPNQPYDTNQQYQQYAAYQDADPNQAYDYTQAYAQGNETCEQQQQQQPAEETIIDSTEPAPSQTAARVDEPPKKKKDAIKAILDSDSESYIEPNLSNTESDFDFN